jgi:hypothetical protein
MPILKPGLTRDTTAKLFLPKFNTLANLAADEVPRQEYYRAQLKYKLPQ